MYANKRNISASIRVTHTQTEISNNIFKFRGDFNVDGSTKVSRARCELENYIQRAL